MKLVKCPKCSGTGKIVDQRELGLEMKSLREKSGISLRQLAERLKISAPYLSDMERGNRNFSQDRVEQVKEICK